MIERGNLSKQPTGGLLFVPDVSNGTLHVWERPRVGCSYLLSVRPGGAMKVVGGSQDRERSVVLVLRAGHLEETRSSAPVWVPTRLACRLVAPTRLDPTPLAQVVADVALWYGGALCIVEVKDGAICAKECQRLGASVMNQARLDRVTSEWKQDIGWLTDDETGPAAYTALQNAIRETGERARVDEETRRRGDLESRWPNALLVECPHVLGELSTFSQPGSDVPAVAHDDDVWTLATGIYNIGGATEYTAEARQRQPPADGWRVAESFAGM
jgi:hypothetical protein